MKIVVVEWREWSVLTECGGLNLVWCGVAYHVVQGGLARGAGGPSMSVGRVGSGITYRRSRYQFTIRVPS